jgi:hypothetical protein
VKAFILLFFGGEGIERKVWDVVQRHEWGSGERRGRWHAVLVMLVKSCEAGGGGWWWDGE